MPEATNSDEEADLLMKSPQDRLPPMPWMVWLMGAAACAALILVVTHLTEEEEFLSLLKQMDLRWLLLALVLQAGTYLMQGVVWRVATGATGHELPLGKSYQISLAMLFVDQALPSAGISGVAVVSGALSRMGLPRAVVASAVLVDNGMYYLAYAACMGVALAVALYHACLPVWVDVAMLIFVLAGAGMCWVQLSLPNGGMRWLKPRLRRFAKLAKLADWLEHAHPAIVKNKRVLFAAFALHVVNFLLDATTIWVAARALGVTASPGGVFSSFMVSTLFRTIGIIPGGLGTFETASVMSLKSIGLPLSLGLSATLLFRGLSFWLPMVPGLVCAKRMLKN